MLSMLAAFEGGGPRIELKKIDDLNEVMQRRFQAPLPNALGMSRVAMPRSLGQHFAPLVTALRDFQPENPRETQVLAALEETDAQVGFYLFGKAIANTSPAEMFFRALKGPAAITRGTPRPAWYPTLLIAPAAASAPDALPDWNEIYPLAQRAMRSFADGGRGFETSIGTWQIAARPVMAADKKCVACHPGVSLNHAVGGALYAFRSARDGS
jgi:hypothetical protein